MANKYIPFSPNSPVHAQMFAGRAGEIKRIQEILFQTKTGNPTHIMIVGERGIGKSSLMLVADYFADQNDPSDPDKYDFLTIQTNISSDLTLPGLASRISTSLNREFQENNKTLGSLQKAWEFLKRIEVRGTGFKRNEKAESDSEFVDNL